MFVSLFVHLAALAHKQLDIIIPLQHLPYHYSQPSTIPLSPSYHLPYNHLQRLSIFQYFDFATNKLFRLFSSYLIIVWHERYFILSKVHVIVYGAALHCNQKICILGTWFGLDENIICHGLHNITSSLQQQCVVGTASCLGFIFLLPQSIFDGQNVEWMCQNNILSIKYLL